MQSSTYPPVSFFFDVVFLGNFQDETKIQASEIPKIVNLSQEPVETRFQSVTGLNVEMQTESRGSISATPVVSPAPLSRARRAHTRLSWQERLTHNARVSTSEQVTIRLFGVPEAVATSLGLATV